MQVTDDAACLPECGAVPNHEEIDDASYVYGDSDHVKKEYDFSVEKPLPMCAMSGPVTGIFYEVDTLPATSLCFGGCTECGTVTDTPIKWNKATIDMVRGGTNKDVVDKVVCFKNKRCLKYDYDIDGGKAKFEDDKTEDWCDEHKYYVGNKAYYIENLALIEREENDKLTVCEQYKSKADFTSSNKHKKSYFDSQKRDFCTFDKDNDAMNHDQLVASMPWCVDLAIVCPEDRTALTAATASDITYFSQTCKSSSSGTIRGFEGFGYLVFLALSMCVLF